MIIFLVCCGVRLCGFSCVADKDTLGSRFSGLNSCAAAPGILQQIDKDAVTPAINFADLLVMTMATLFRLGTSSIGGAEGQRVEFGRLP